METHAQKSTIALFSAYMALVLWLLLVRQRDIPMLPYWQHTAMHFNPVPLQTILLYCRLLFRPEFCVLAIANLVGNVVLFIPLGLLLPTIFGKLRRFWRTELAAIALVCGLEVLQMLLLVGTCDIDDLILNGLGAAIGYGIYKLFNR